MSISLIATIVVLAFLAFFVIKGFRKGFLRILFTTFSIILTVAISACFTNTLAEFLTEKTSIGPGVEEKIESYIDRKFAEKEQEAQDKEEDFIESLPLPQFLKNKIQESNTLTEYRTVGVNSFKEYIVAKLSDITMKAIAFLMLSVVIYILLRIIFHLLKIISRIPILRGLNKILGMVIGLAEGLLILWCICILIMAFSTSDLGTKCVEVIQQSKVLSLIYDHNLLIKAANAVFKFL